MLALTDIIKLGNTLIYIAKKIPLLSKTKALKLLYLMEDYSVKRFQQPFLGLPFEVWQAGPVIKDVFIDLSQTPTFLSNYITTETKENQTFIKAKKDFSDDEFSDNDIIVMDDIIKKYGNKTAKQLVEITHDKNGLWYKTSEKYNLLEPFKNKQINNSNFEIDLSEQLPECERLFYKEQLDFLNMSRQLC